ncbi:helix-turn-helix domain-containing protein [Alteromonas sp. 1_MG-2023]|uniref:Crp/Fnr family transcriptional regulator n=1 Tax=unclassified Alteromonas TaxID=2614992 RepID=UPI0026E2E288|nr:helix-turn-helix domain-containing protein [Alteromonas sp. 1_MG-2023]MDO6475124.1 helix-turn-helix domain-containing protein [Alteromonas sp. 1_MG-2023]
MLQLCHPTESPVRQNDCPLFKSLSADEMLVLSQNARLRLMDRQQYLCLQHSPSDRVFNMASGCAMVERISNDGRRQILAFVFAGDFIGLSNSEHYEYGIKCLTPSTAYEFKRKKLYELSEEIPTLKQNLKSLRSMILQLTFDQVYLLGQLNAYERVGYAISHFLKRIPGATPEHIELPMTRADIGDYLGLTVETVSRTLSRLKKDGLITTPSPTSIRIMDLESLTSLVNIE